MVELLLKYGVPVVGSGALHHAAEIGALDIMRLLIEHGANVNELHLAEMISPHVQLLYSSWMPMHFAAYGGRLDAMMLLESNGARSDVKDVDGKTPAQLFEEHK